MSTSDASLSSTGTVISGADFTWLQLLTGPELGGTKERHLRTWASCVHTSGSGLQEAGSVLLGPPRSTRCQMTERDMGVLPKDAP